MFKVNGHPILADEIEVLEELRRQCALNGLFIFKTFKNSGDNIMTTCPFHKGGQERRPSFGISRVNMLCHCFACGWAGTLEDMISQVFGKYDDGDFGRKWLSKNFLTVSVETRKPLYLNLSRQHSSSMTNNPGFTEEELDKYRYYHPYMYERGLTHEIIEEFDVGYDKDTDCLTFPVYHHDSAPAFIARRSVRYKFFHYPRGTEKPVYAAEKIIQKPANKVMICESILNALTGWKYGVPSVALMGTGTDFQYKILRMLPVRHYVIATDPDDAGQKAAMKLRNALKDCKIITQLDIPKGEDINSLDVKFLELPEYF